MNTFREKKNQLRKGEPIWFPGLPRSHLSPAPTPCPPINPSHIHPSLYKHRCVQMLLAYCINPEPGIVFFVGALVIGGATATVDWGCLELPMVEAVEEHLG